VKDIQEVVIFVELRLIIKYFLLQSLTGSPKKMEHGKKIGLVKIAVVVVKTQVPFSLSIQRKKKKLIIG